MAMRAKVEERMRETMSAAGLLDVFDNLRQGLNSFVDALPKKEVKEVRCALVLSATKDGVDYNAWFLLAKAVYNPKAQVLIRCCPEMVDSVDGLVAETCEPPYNLVMLRRPSRFHIAQPPGAMEQTLFHETSED